MGAIERGPLSKVAQTRRRETRERIALGMSYNVAQRMPRLAAHDFDLDNFAARITVDILTERYQRWASKNPQLHPQIQVSASPSVVPRDVKQRAAWLTDPEHREQVKFFRNWAKAMEAISGR